jgi:lysine 6-dehydrogenase
MKIIVLGGGLVGGPMAIDLAKDEQFEVTVADYSQSVLDKFDPKLKIGTTQQDLSNPADVTALVADFDLVINAVPGFMGFKTLEAIIKASKNVVDIAFYSEDPFLLDSLAKEHDVSVIVDCGVCPGMSNVLIGNVDNILDETESILIYVGGLPEKREWPYEYKAVFSPVDVIEEYVRPARYVENGVLVTRPALSDPELISFPNLGTLEAFNSDGLRSLAVTMNAPNMKEKTLRYPGHIDKMAVFRESGFFSEEEIEINGTKIKPVDFTAKLLFPMWEMKEGDIDVTVLQLIIEGKKAGKSVRYTYDLYDRLDEATNTNSMARTTGYTATVAARMLAAGLFSDKGISPPEFIGKYPECVDFMVKGLEARGIVYEETVETIK